jgi:LDH2 family malate/lactate/ureidoglycolate dehydrogenase
LSSDRAQAKPGVQLETNCAGLADHAAERLLRLKGLFAAIAESGVERLPAERRYAQRERALRDGIALSDRDWARLEELLT